MRAHQRCRLLQNSFRSAAMPVIAALLHPIL
jgi:hypothetical protein